MGNTNNNWVYEKLNTACIFKSGKTVSKDIEKQSGDILYVKVGDMNIEGNEEFITTSSRFVDIGAIKNTDIIPVGAVIFPKRGGAIATNKKRKIIKPTIVDLNTMAVIPTKKLSADLLYYWFFSFDLVDISNGTSIPQINNNSFENIFINYPESLEAQKQIVALLDQAFAAIDQAKANIEKNIQNAQELFQSKLNDIFSQTGEGWEEKRIDEITTILGDGLHGTPEYSLDGDYHFINGNNLSNGRIEIKERTKKVTHEEYLKYKKILTDRTIFVSINGTLGNVAFYNNEKVILGKSACYFNLIEGISKYFIKYNIQSPQFMKYMLSESTGATIKNFSLKSMRAYKVQLPSLEEQGKITIKLDKLYLMTKNLESAYKTKLTNLEELKKSILQKAFNGELT